MLDKTGSITKFEQSQIASLNALFDVLFSGAISIKYTSVVPTASTAAQNELIVYDDGAGTKRIYVITGKKNLGYVNLT
jgi:hypothetical protein